MHSETGSERRGDGGKRSGGSRTRGSSASKAYGAIRTACLSCHVSFYFFFRSFIPFFVLQISRTHRVSQIERKRERRDGDRCSSQRRQLTSRVTFGSNGLTLDPRLCFA